MNDVPFSNAICLSTFPAGEGHERARSIPVEGFIILFVYFSCLITFFLRVNSLNLNMNKNKREKYERLKLLLTLKYTQFQNAEANLKKKDIRLMYT